MLEKVIHHWLRMPFTLHVRYCSTPKKAKATIILLHGIGANGAYWSKLLPLLPKDVAVISLDLLGFGDSPKPSWTKYNARTQARAVMRTLKHMKFPAPRIVVGHSLGSLIAVELASRYPRFVTRLVLIAPPFYTSRHTGVPQPRTDKILQSLYGLMQSYPKQFVLIARMILKTKLLNPSLDVSNQSVGVFMSALRASIVNQTSLQDAAKLRVPIHIIRGAFDPFVVPSHLKQLARTTKNVTLTTLPTSHELNKRMTSATAKIIANVIASNGNDVSKNT